MTTIPDRRRQDLDAVLFVCDTSPPRSGEGAALEEIAGLPADFVCVAYNPGKAVRVNSVAAAGWLRGRGREVVATLGTRDMNKVAAQSLLLGASLMGVENVLVLAGDPFSEREREGVRSVDDYTPSGLLASIRGMNEGVDYRGGKLAATTRLCAGATVDLSRGVEREVTLTRRKAEAGAQFFLMQPPWDAGRVEAFLGAYERSAGSALEAPVFVGLQVMTAESVRFGEIPQGVLDDLDRGRPGEEIALEGLEALVARGFRSVYLVPPIMRGGRRDYATASRVIEGWRGRS